MFSRFWKFICSFRVFYHFQDFFISPLYYDLPWSHLDINLFSSSHMSKSRCWCLFSWLTSLVISKISNLFPFLQLLTHYLPTILFCTFIICILCIFSLNSPEFSVLCLRRTWVFHWGQSSVWVSFKLSAIAS